MYPFENPFQWFAASRYQHLVEGTKGAGLRLPVELHARLERRRRALVQWGKVRAGILAALYFGIIAAAATWILEAVGIGQAGGILQAIAQSLTGLAGVLAAAFLGVTRLLGQLEVDVLMILALHLPDPPAPVRTTEAVLPPIPEKRKSSRTSRKVTKKGVQSRVRRA